MIKKPKHNAKSIHNKNNYTLSTLAAIAVILALALLTPSLTGLLIDTSLTLPTSITYCLSPTAPAVGLIDRNPNFGLSFSNDSSIIETVYALDKNNRKLYYISLPGTSWNSKTISTGSELYTLEVPLKPPTFAAVGTSNSIVYASADAPFKFVRKSDDSALPGEFIVSDLQATDDESGNAIFFDQKNMLFYSLTFIRSAGIPILAINKQWSLSGRPIANKGYSMSVSGTNLLLLTADSKIIHYSLSTPGVSNGTLRASRLFLGPTITAVLAPKSGSSFYFGTSNGKLYRQIYTSSRLALAPVQVAGFSGEIKSIQQTDTNTLYVLTNTTIHRYSILDNAATRAYALNPSELNYFIQLITGPNKEVFVSARLKSSSKSQLFNVTNTCD